MHGNGEDSPGTNGAKPLNGVEADAVLIASQFLGEVPDLTNPPELTWGLAQHLRRTFTEALCAQPAADGSEPKSVLVLMNASYQAVRDAIAAQDGSLEQLIEASRLREQERLEEERFARLGAFARWRARKAGKAAAVVLTPQVVLSTKSLKI